jgi:uncharacterized protein YutE (UPF0331/DUF86 family)
MVEAVNDVADEINSVLNGRKKEKYFDSIMLLYSVSENLLKWAIFVEILWIKAGAAKDPRSFLPEEELKALKGFCRGLTFFNAQHVALCLNLIDLKAFRKLDSIRKERNDIVHQLWLYAQRDNRSVLRKKLERLARVVNQLVLTSSKVSGKIGIEEIYEIFL